MKILMLNPPFEKGKKFSRQSRSPCVTKGGTFYYPYYLAYGTGALENAGFETKLVDAVARDWDIKETVAFAKNYDPDLVVIETSTPSIPRDAETAKAIKEALPNAHVAMGNIHAKCMPEETLKLSNADSAIRGEYDNVAVELARAIEKRKPLSSVDGISFRSNGKITHNKEAPLFQDLDSLPFVSDVYLRHFGVSGIKKYFYASLRWPQVTILTGRGCLYNCAFCNIPYKKSYRPRSPENVVKEFEFIEAELPFVQEVMVEDDTFPLNRERTEKFCNMLIERGVKIRWSCNARVNTELETLEKMQKAGCRLMCVGFESATQEVLNTIRKGTTKSMQMDFMRRARKARLLVNGCFIHGLPSDTPETMKATLELAKKLNPDTAQFYPLMVYPGTDAYAWAERNGHLITKDYSKWLTSEGWHDTTVSRKDLTKDEVVRMCDLSRKEYYVRPKYIAWKTLQSLRYPEEFRRNLIGLNVFKDWFFKAGIKAK
ncbi:hypothetical protein A3K63_01615 [Candidatus Micrarchaeota archaeon RBG_16_49_10]|nr:MAG: hypothetical protein A3K63_01615 [Candidatus Micrarchaeota archaeon RBG_16_49_10]